MNNGQSMLMNGGSHQLTSHTYGSEGQMLPTSFAMEGVVLSSTASHQGQHFVAVPTSQQQELQQQQLHQQMHQIHLEQQLEQQQQQQQQQHLQQMMEPSH
ncbi:hypothetical protein BGZ76_006131, partial [Entomortierella beljakovae]